MAGQKKNTNAQKGDVKRDDTVTFRVPKANKKAWIKSAKKDGITLADFMIEAANEKIGRGK